jgi:hypothetical protein
MPSLQDQLLNAGMVDAKKAKQVAKDKRREAKLVRKGEAVANDEAKLAAQQKQAQKAAKDRALNQQNQLQAEQKAVAAQIKQLIKSHRIERNNNDIGYQFVDGKKIKKLYVDATQQRQLEKGHIGIVLLEGEYQLVAAIVAEKIQQRDAQTVVLLNTKKEAADTNDEDDPYADFEIPDDLMW